jgi:hypothetical protein
MTDSLTASPPDNELMEPTLTVSPDVSTQPSLAADSGSPARLPQPAASSVTAATNAAVYRRRHAWDEPVEDPNM